MKNLVLPFLFLAFSVNAQQNEAVDLRWKINDTLTYKNVMKEITVKREEIKKDSIDKESVSFMKKYYAQMSNLKYEIKLFPDKRKNIDITMRLTKDKKDTTSYMFGIAAMFERVLLRGKISPKGELLSFYYGASKNSMISILFELPVKPVKVGDIWSVQFNSISISPDFIGDSIFKKNTVLFEKIIEKDGDKIAVLKYDIEEYVSGHLEEDVTPNKSGKGNEKRFIKTTLQATGFFSIKKGMWIQYKGAMEIDLNFLFQEGIKRTEFNLIYE